MRTLTGREAILATFVVIGAHELSAARGQLISHVFDEWMKKRPVLTIAATFIFANLTAVHLCNLVEGTRWQRFDPWSGCGSSRYLTLVCRALHYLAREADCALVHVDHNRPGLTHLTVDLEGNHVEATWQTPEHN